MTQNWHLVKSKAAAILALAAGSSLSLGSGKSSYNLFNPTPREQMREISTDRPDVTESPFTVDAGHVQIEMSFVDYVYDDDDGQASTWSIAPSNFKIGLLSNADIQFVFEPYVNERLRTGGETHTADGFGTAEVRFKLNLWGNDGGNTAFAVMPFVAFPTTAGDDLAATDHVEGGLIFPLAIALPHGWNLGLMAEVDFVRNSANDGYGTQLIHTATFGHDISDKLAGYVEYVGIGNADLDAGYVAKVGCGLTYGLSSNVQLDGGMNFGISDAADDFNTFVGISVRQ